MRFDRIVSGRESGGRAARRFTSGVDEMMIHASEALQFLMVRAALVHERLWSGVTYNPLSARMAQDPYPFYARLRERDPVHRSRVINAWLFTRHADVDAVLRDHRHFGNDPRKGNLSRRQAAMLPAPDEYTLLSLDAPDHTRLRALVTKAFTRAAVDAIEARIRGIMESLLDDIDDPGAFDLIAAVAQPLPVIVIAEMIGVPPEDRAQFKIWSAQRARLLEPMISARERKRGAVASRDLNAYFRSIIAKRRAEPRDDIVSDLVQAKNGGDRLSERETLNMLRLLLVGGNETTTNLIGNGVLALLRNPDELQRLREAPDLIPTAVEELLRFDSPVQADVRRVLTDCEVNGFPVRKRDNLFVLIGAANRDPDVFENPGRLDVGRSEGSHLSFGRGIHHCLGAPLARLEGRIALEMLLDRFSAMRLLDDCPRFHRAIVLRGLESLPLRCTRA